MTKTQWLKATLLALSFLVAPALVGVAAVLIGDRWWFWFVPLPIAVVVIGGAFYLFSEDNSK